MFQQSQCWRDLPHLHCARNTRVTPPTSVKSTNTNTRLGLTTDKVSYMCLFESCTTLRFQRIFEILLI